MKKSIVFYINQKRNLKPPPTGKTFKSTSPDENPNPGMVEVPSAVFKMHLALNDSASTSLFVIAGAYVHGVIKELLFGSRMEEIHTILPNNLLIVGPYATV